MAVLPKISIVTPSLNQAAFLEETIRSVLDQEYPSLEYVIVDGGSTDGSAGIIEKYGDRLHGWVSEKDQGHAHAINKGFSLTSGEIMAWINSDDKYLPWTFRVVAEIFTRFPRVSWITGFNAWWNDQGVLTAAGRCQRNIYDFLLGNYEWIQQESVFWRRSLWEKAGGCVDGSFRFMVDGELWSRFFLHDDLVSLDCILGGYRVHSGNRALRNRDACRAEMEKAVAAMRRKCSRDVLRGYPALKAVDVLKKALFLERVPFSRGLRGIVPAFGKADYRNIWYKDGAWVERTLPFSL